MTFLPQFERELLAAHRRNVRKQGSRPFRWAWRRLIPRAWILPVGALVLAGSAAGASLIFGVGPSVKPAPQPYAIANPAIGETSAQAAEMVRQIGQPQPATARTYTVQADSAGGPAWGILVYRTSTGTVCEHAGRVIDGKVGILDTHRMLHPWQSDPSGCALGMLAVHAVAAEGGDLTNGGALNCYRPDERNRPSGAQICPPNVVRTLMEGVIPENTPITPHGVGPISVTFTTRTGQLTEPTPGGAFLFVTDGRLRCENWPSVTVTYSDGSKRSDPLLGPDIACARASRR